MKNNETMCLLKSKMDLKSQMAIIKSRLDDAGKKYKRLAIAKKYTGSGDEGKYKITLVTHGVKEESRGSKIFMVFEQSYNYLQGKYNDELIIVQKEVDAIPCECSD